METFFEGFDADGLLTEGLSYWNYGFGSFALPLRAGITMSRTTTTIWGISSCIAVVRRSMKKHFSAPKCATVSSIPPHAAAAFR